MYFLQILKYKKKNHQVLHYTFFLYYKKYYGEENNTYITEKHRKMYNLMTK